MAELKSCPFCDAKLPMQGNGLHRHVAPGCILSGYSVERGEIDLWNTRPPASGELREAAETVVAAGANTPVGRFGGRHGRFQNWLRDELGPALAKLSAALASGERP